MFQGLKLLHIGGLVILLGSILTFIIISALVEGGSVENLAFGRKIISTGTNILTLPGLGILAVTGIWMGLRRYGPKQWFFQLKLLLLALIALNGYFFVAPAVSLATDLAVRSLSEGQLLPAYRSAYMQESVFGSINIALTIMAAIIGVWRIGAKAPKD